MGIAIIIPNASFAGSPLGRVTKAETTEEKISAYLASVGADDTKKEKLITLYDSLEGLGVLSTLDVFPMLGSSLANKLKPLNSVNFDTLIVGNNASSGTIGIDFTNTVAASVPQYTTVEKDFDNAYVFASVQRSGELAQSVFAYHKGGNATANGYIFRSVSKDSKKAMVATNSGGSGTISQAVESDGVFVDISVAITNSDIKNLTGGIQTASESHNFSTVKYNMNNVIGCDALTGDADSYPNAKSFGGSCRMYAIGFVPANKVAQVDAAFRTYLA